MSNTFFDLTKPSLLQAQTFYTNVNKYLSQDDLATILCQEATDKYTVIARNVHELKFGYYENNTFNFPDNSELNPVYLLSLRLFNQNSEILVQKVNSMYQVRIIQDKEFISGEDDKYSEIEAVDNASTLFGKRTGKLSNNFVHLADSGRKIKFIIPATNEADYYSLKTRSYITYDNETGQAGYGYYRYVSIQPENEEV